MTAEKIHDALNLLPPDLITATDKLRTAPRKREIPWKQIIPVAACAAILICCGSGWVLQEHFQNAVGGAVSLEMKQETAQAPAAAAPLAPETGNINEIPAEEAVPEEAPAADAAGSSAAQTAGEPLEEELCIDHSHRFAEETTEDRPAVGYCGNMMTTIYLDGEEHSFAGSDSVAVTDILINLDYDPGQVCRCMAEFTVDTEMITGIQVNLTEGFARCEAGQAALTENQANTIREIINSLL